MADNVTANAGSGGAIFATDQNPAGANELPRDRHGAGPCNDVIRSRTSLAASR